MNTPANVPVVNGEPVSPVYKRRISAKVRKALQLRVREGLTWAEAAERAGLSEAGIYKARKQPHVQATYETMIAQQTKEVEELRRPLKAIALKEAKRLMTEAKSESVRARMVEFLAGERDKSPAVAVQINNNMGGSGYEYVPPGASIVEIRGEGDTPSPAESRDSQENNGD